jgi:hypothetical protein
VKDAKTLDVWMVAVWREAIVDFVVADPKVRWESTLSIGV